MIAIFQEIDGYVQSVHLPLLSSSFNKAFRLGRLLMGCDTYIVRMLYMVIFGGYVSIQLTIKKYSNILNLPKANIFVDAQGGIKLSDFGLTTFTDTTTLSWRTFSGGAARWTAPEILQDSRPTWASDMYAFGCVFLEVRFTFSYPIVCCLLKGNLDLHKSTPVCGTD